MLRFLTKALGFLGGIVFLTSCATTSIIDTWRNPNVAGVRLHKLLIVQTITGGGDKPVYEHILASELQRRGVEAVPSYAVIPQNKKRDRQALDRAARQAGAEAVLTMQMGEVKSYTTIQPGYAYSHPGYAYGYPGYYYPYSFPSTWELYGQGSTTYYQPPYASTYQVATIQVNLFDVRNGALLWAATVQSSEPGNVVPVGKDLARIIIKSLSSEGFI